MKFPIYDQPKLTEVIIIVKVAQRNRPNNFLNAKKFKKFYKMA